MANESGFKEALLKLRGIHVDSWARLTLQVTSSAGYARCQNLFTAPAFAAAGLWRKTAEPAAAQALALWNLPSRAEVVSLAGRMTRIETTLDDLALALDRLGAPRPATTKASKPDAVQP